VDLSRTIRLPEKTKKNSSCKTKNTRNEEPTAATSESKKKGRLNQAAQWNNSGALLPAEKNEAAFRRTDGGEQNWGFKAQKITEKSPDHATFIASGRWQKTPANKDRRGKTTRLHL